jgi:peptidoglycan/LPS O-acetylase OafA/YrhL
MTAFRTTHNAAVNRLEIVDCLRGVAALAVCVSHFMSGNNGIPRDAFVITAGTFGWLGVEIFFVISGFIIPYSLHRAGYQPWNYPMFLLKRVIRLDPPYLVAVIVAIAAGVLAAGSASYQGAPFQLSVPQVLLHFAYLNAFFGYPWVNGVFWTLAIEFQYYVAVGLLFPMIAHPALRWRTALFLLLGVLAMLLPQKQFLFRYLFLFMLGMLAFQLHAKLLNPRSFLVGLFLLGVGAFATLGPLRAATGVGTALLIAFVQVRSSFLLFFGAIPYSMYLFHVPLGSKVVNWGGRYVNGTLGGLAVVSAALVITILFSWGIYLWVERPAQRWSSAIKYRPHRASQ